MSYNEKLFTRQESNRLTDEPTKRLIGKIIHYLETAVPLLFNFRVYETTFTAAGTKAIKHGVNGVPQDIVLTYVSDSSKTVTFEWENFTEDSIILTASGPCSVRFMAGRFKR